MDSGQTAIGYHSNEEQATFLITLLKNTPPVVAFKQELVRQFYAMRTELQKQQIEREWLEPIRRYLPDNQTESNCLKYFNGFQQWMKEEKPTDKKAIKEVHEILEFSLKPSARQ